ncbi:non-receptor tyrosine-protein kinase TNK1 isoform X5 [Balaenoptera musculus]|uniref:Non-receptor tyrosine-protein kinase TNK1 n=1 Tax=Balaenoptera musculus TaxID=9771 RepID=A0A8B8W6P8_BALMU|nr:non-receptor tyrosine-protein kinase TNK1 isoform X5 [Balaenoptera musculus]
MSLPLYLSISEGLRVEQATTSLVPECLRCPPWAMCLGQGTTGVPPPDMLHEAGSLWLLRLLQDIQLAQFYRPILEELNVTRPEHFDFVRPEDLDGVGMGRPAQRRLAEALKRHRSGLKSKNWVYKILGGFAPGQKETTPPSDSLPSLPEPDGGLKCLIPDRAVCRGELLGSGCFGVVHRGLWTLPSGKTVPVAVKSLRVGPDSPGPEGTELGDFLREVSIMMNLEHPHLLCLHGLVLGQPLQMVMELAPLGSLHARLTAPAPTPPLPVALLCLFLRQVAGAMAYLGARGLVHRDLATRNLLLASPRTIKVADFGLVRSLGGARGHYVMGGPRRIPFAWCAPESLRHGAFSSASDVWMFGVTLWEMFSGGEEPWAGVPPYLILQRLEKDRARLRRPPLCSRALYALALRCWAPHPADRPTFSYLEGLLQEAWPPEGRCVRDVTEPGALRMEPGDPITIIEGSASSHSPDSTTWKGQNGRTFKVGNFPASAVTLVDSPATRPVLRGSPARGERHQGNIDGRDRVKVKLRDPPPARGQRRNVALQRMKGISKSLESVLSLGPRPTGGGAERAWSHPPGVPRGSKSHRG